MLLDFIKIVLTFCLGVIALHCVIPVDVRLERTKKKLGKDAEILILGAGMAGVTAAKTLHEAGYHNYRIIEASHTIGGRIRHAHIDKYQVELGAMWIYGKGSNPIYKLVRDFNTTVAGSLADDWTVRDEYGNDVTPAADEAYDTFEKVLKRFKHLVAQSKNGNLQDFNVMSAIRHLDWNPETVVDDVVESYALDFETGTHPSALSSFNLVLEETFEDFGNYEMLGVTDTRGFSSMVHSLLDTFMEAGDNRLQLNTTVDSIHYTDTGTRVVTTDGEVHTADYVIVTFSVGVLQARDVTFHPPLSSHKQRAIDKFGFAAFTHLYVQFPIAFWDDTMYLLFASRTRGRFSVWQNLNRLYPECNILQLSLFSDDSLWAERSAEHEILLEITKALQQMYPSTVIPDPIGFQMSRWNTDTLFRGGFSYWPASFTDGDMDELRAPVGRVYFAGEHLHPVHYGFVHAAYLTGESTANEIIDDTRTNEFQTQFQANANHNSANAFQAQPIEHGGLHSQYNQCHSCFRTPQESHQANGSGNVCGTDTIGLCVSNNAGFLTPHECHQANSSGNGCGPDTIGLCVSSKASLLLVGQILATRLSNLHMHVTFLWLVLI